MRRQSMDLRRHIIWLAPAVSIGIVLATIGPSILAAQGTRILADSGALHPAPAVTSPQGCGDCHAQEFQEWATSTHAAATFDPIFQLYLQEARQPGECFACHATGYSMATGQFLLAGVSCEACHGPYSPDHPSETMVIARSPVMCGECHPRTLEEWRTSDHGANGVTCIDCHAVHTQRTHAESSTTELCFSCHSQEIEGDIHVDHQPSDIACIACHLARPGDMGVPINGQVATAHSFTVVSATCADCHPDNYGALPSP